MAPGTQNGSEKAHLDTVDTTDEVKPFIVGESKKDSEFGAPKDVYNAVYFIMLLHGIGCLMPWNMFITIAGKYFVGYKMLERTDNGTLVETYYSTEFFGFLGMFSQLPNLLLNLINIFVRMRGGLKPRIAISLCIVGAVCIFTMCFIFVDSNTWVFGFFVMTMFSVAILNGANGVYQNSIYGVASAFPPKFTNAILIGNNICGTFVSIISILTILLSDDVRFAALFYFLVAFFTIVACLVSFFMLERFDFYVYYARKANQKNGDEEGQQQEEEHISMERYAEVLKQAWPQMFNVFCIFFVTLSIFPTIQVDIKLYREDGVYDFFIPQKLYEAITTFLLFNVCATIGSTLANSYQWPNPKTLWIPVVLRLLLIPAFMFCNFRPAVRTWKVFFYNEWIFIVLSIIMAVSSGYLSSMGMMFAPHVVEPKNSRIAGMMAAFFLIFGVCCGILNTFVIGSVIEW
uniref:Equilibrative nucleoside transporter 1 n=1 Tax=Steinernema glaseri TaxID=37863 RepID=A0A1I7Z3X4_9BILA